VSPGAGRHSPHASSPRPFKTPRTAYQSRQPISRSTKMRCSLTILAALAFASSILSSPIPQDDSDGLCLGSSFSPTNCGDNSIDMSPDIDISPSIGRRQSDDDCIGSSFSPTNCGDNSIDVSPDVDVSPSVDLSNLLDLSDLLELPKRKQ
jgi:hypothetical protein